jgi:Ca-activated chloride channel homolog
MTILYPDSLYFLFLLIPALLLFLFLYRRNTKDLETLTGKKILKLFGTIYTVKWFFRGIFFLLAVGLLILSLAGISWGETTVEEDREGLEIMITIDISRSMLAQDAAPSRLRKSGEVIRGLVNGIPEGKYGTVIFKGKASQVIPITEDKVLLESFLDYLSSGMISAPGSNIGEGIKLALESFPEGSDRNRVILLFTDGENILSREDSVNAVRTAFRSGQRGIPIYTVACGTAAGSTIPLSDGTVLTDEEGEKVVTRMNVPFLQEISRVSSGEYFLLSDPEIFARLTRAMEEYNEVKIKEGFRVIKVKRYRLFLFFAVVFLVLRVLIRAVRWRDSL